MIFHLCVDGPNIALVPDAGDDVIDCSHGSQHGMVLIVVFVHSISANQVQIMEAIKEFADDMKSVVGTKVGRVGLWNPHHMCIGYVASPQNSNRSEERR